MELKTSIFVKKKLNLKVAKSIFLICSMPRMFFNVFKIILHVFIHFREILQKRHLIILFYNYNQ